MKMQCVNLYALIRAMHEAYGTRLSASGPASVFLSKVGDLLFHVFPIFRDIVYVFNPSAANF